MKDIHSHILYGIDDGAKSLEESIEILKKASTRGVTDIILTPHYILDSIYTANITEKKQRLKELKQKLKELNININLYLGNEVYIDSSLSSKLRSISTLNNSRYLLIELPLNNKCLILEEVLYQLKQILGSDIHHSSSNIYNREIEKDLFKIVKNKKIVEDLLVNNTDKVINDILGVNVVNESEALELENSITISKKLYFGVKRMVDIFFALIGIIFLLPITIIVKLMYLITKDTNSIFYTQKRVGRNGKLIYIYKFRSMVPNADEELKKLLKKKKYRKEWEANQKLENDPRITKIGKILRKTSLDEMPQFINVLKGDMSFIGPRPLVVGELDSHNGNHEIYESVRPGITGWWAANGRSDIDYEERLNLEYFYAQNCSLLLDIKCFFKTIAVVVMKKGVK